MPTSDQDDELALYIGSRIRIEKAGDVHDGVLLGRSPVLPGPRDDSPALRPWLLDAGTTEIHFSANNGWSVRVLDEAQR